MAFARRLQVVVLVLLFFLAVASTAVPVSRSLKTIENQMLFSSFHSQDVKKMRENYDGALERRMSIELTDYPGTGANHDHDPRPPGKS